MDNEKVFFEKEFLQTADDRLLLSFFEMKASQIFRDLLNKGYSKAAITDGVNYVMAQWRDRP